MEFKKKEKGWYFSIQCAETERGHCRASEFFAGLPDKVRAKFLGLLALVVMNGQLRDETKFRILENSGGIWEFKQEFRNVPYRLYCFFHEDQLVLTHGSEKKKTKELKIEIEYAQKLKKIYRERKR